MIIMATMLLSMNGYLVFHHNYKETASYSRSVEQSGKVREMGLASQKMIEEQLNMKNSILKLMKNP
jgi:hypothetical protein